MAKKIKVLELFSGVGGLSYGFSKLPEFDIVAANEIDRDIAKAYTQNHPNVKMINDDIHNITAEKLVEVTEGEAIDIVVGGPPCQSYSTLGKREMDARANLFQEYKRILSILMPKVFIYENVSGLLSMDSGKLFLKIKSEFNELGYELQHKLLNAVDYGVPQYRERVILVGVLGKNQYKYPEPKYGNGYGLKNYITLAEAIGDLPKLKSGQSADYYTKEPDNSFLKFVRDTNVLTEHAAPKHGEHLIKIMQTLKDGESKDDLPQEIRPKSGYNNTYAKLWWDRPSTTITRNFACPSSSRCIHPRDSRSMSIREGARLQSFPDSYSFYGSDGSKRLQIGNAVPPLLSHEIAKSILLLFE